MPSQKRTKAQSFELKCTAYHEAGHAVAACELDLPLRRISIVPNDDDGSLGHCARPGLPRKFENADKSNKTRLRIEKEILLKLSGAIAEARFRGQDNLQGAVDDNCELELYAETVCSSSKEIRKFLAWLKERARNLLNSKRGILWRAVRYIAKELVARQQIGPKTVKELLRKAAQDVITEQSTKRAKQTSIPTHT
jgi:ATP-dependent Zn protease